MARPPAELQGNIVPHATIWTFAHQVSRMQVGDRLTIRTNCPGVLTRREDGVESPPAELAPTGGGMAGVRRYQVTLGPFPSGTRVVSFRFRCTERGCSGQDVWCDPVEYAVQIAHRPEAAESPSPKKGS